VALIKKPAYAADFTLCQSKPTAYPVFGSITFCDPVNA